MAPPYHGGGARSSYSGALGLTSPEWCRGSVAADRGSWELQQAEFELRKAGTEAGWPKKKHDSRWVAPLLASFHAIPASFDATGWSGGKAGALRSVEVSLSVGEVTREGKSVGGRKK